MHSSVVAALEIAYAKATGQVVKFSEQEMTDCYNNGCEGGDYKMVTITMSYLDKLSSKLGYGNYLSKQLTCRMDTTPDALKAIKVTFKFTFSLTFTFSPSRSHT